MTGVTGKLPAMPKGIPCLAALAAAVPLYVAAADDPFARGFDPDTSRPALGLDADFTVESATPMPAGSWRGEILLDYARGLLAVRSGDAKLGNLIDDRLTAHLLAGYAFGRLEIGLDLPITLTQGSNLGLLTSTGVTGPLVAPIAGSALGDVRLVARMPLFTERRLPVSLAALLDLRAPTGNGSAFASDGAMGIPGIVATRQAGPVRLDAQLGYVLRGQGQYAQLVVHDALAFGVAASLPLPRAGAIESWRGIAELTGQIPRGSALDSVRYRAPLGIRAGVRAKLWRFLGLDLGGGTGLGEAGYGRESWRVFAGLRWDYVFSDRDGDGVADDRDECPDVPGLAEFHGCPEPRDRDGDGIADDRDRCPTEKGPPELEGCPDSDGDGVPDIDDKCPHEPGPAQNDGCPVVGPAVEIETTRLSLKDSINFDTGMDTLRPESHRILGTIAEILRSHRELQRMRVEGHTDNVGTASYNKDLSRRRASRVVEYLTAHGVTRERLVPEGYGFERPVMSNATALGRAKNRRVEFTILDEAASNPRSTAK